MSNSPRVNYVIFIHSPGPGSPNTQHSSSSSSNSSGSSIAAAAANNNSYTLTKPSGGFEVGKTTAAAAVYGSATAANLSPAPMTTMHGHAPFMTSSLVSSLSPFSTGVLSSYHATDIKNTLTSFIWAFQSFICFPFFRVSILHCVCVFCYNSCLF